MNFEVTILGNSSASPTSSRHPAAQSLKIHNNHILIDCGEGTQMQLSRYKIKRADITQIYISHIHGDHMMGLPGLLLSMNLARRESSIEIFCPQELVEVLELYFKYSETNFSYKINYHLLNEYTSEIIFENDDYTVKSFPVFHRVPTWGFIFQEKRKYRKINQEACKKFNIPFEAYTSIKMGNDFTDENGLIIKNIDLTFDSIAPLSYAYCTDTLFHENVIKAVTGVDLLYHEATFLHDRLERAINMMHSTAKQAGIVAARAMVKMLLIGHFSSRYEALDELLAEAKSEFDNVELADEGKCVNLNFI